MLSRHHDFDRGFAWLHALDRELDRAVRTNLPHVPTAFWRPAAPAMERLTNAPFAAAFADEGTRYVLRAQLPGLSVEDIDLKMADGALTIRAHREVQVPEGYRARMRERTGIDLQTTVGLPKDADLDKASASMKDGVLTLELLKVAAAKPRQIPVKLG